MTSSKLTNEIVDERLINGNRTIKRIGDYKNSGTKIEWQCLIIECNYRWFNRPGHILSRKQGCPKCAKRIPLNNEIVDERLKNRTVIRLGECKNNSDKIKFKCLVSKCNYEWLTSPSSIFNNGCPKCSGNVRLTNEIVDERLKNRNIKRLNNIINTDTKIEWKCLKEHCNHIWETTPNSILSGKKGCPKCAGRLPLTNEIVDKKLEIINIKRLGDISNSEIKIEWQCLKENCNHIWLATPTKIINYTTGCPKCNTGGSLPLLNNDIDHKLQNRLIKRIENYINARTKIKWQCLKEDCNYIWSAIPDSIINAGSGCPNCSFKGQNEKLIFNYLIDKKISFVYQKKLAEFTNEKIRHSFDFYFPDLKLVIEYNGRQHYETTSFFGAKNPEEEFEKQKLRDTFKREFCQNNNIKLIEIDGRKLIGNKLKKYLDQEILSLLVQ